MTTSPEGDKRPINIEDARKTYEQWSQFKEFPMVTMDRAIESFYEAKGYIQAWEEVVKEAEKFIPHMRHDIDCEVLCCDKCDCGYESALKNWQSFKQGGKNG